MQRRLVTDLCQVSIIDVKYTRLGLKQLGLKKNLQVSVVKPIMFTTQEMKFSVKDLFSKYERNSWRKTLFFAHWFASKYTENYCEEENKLFFEKLCCFFIHIFWKSHCILPIFYRWVFRCKILKPLIFLFVRSSIHSIGTSSFAMRKYVESVVILT